MANPDGLPPRTTQFRRRSLESSRPASRRDRHMRTEPQSALDTCDGRPSDRLLRRRFRDACQTAWRIPFGCREIGGYGLGIGDVLLPTPAWRAETAEQRSYPPKEGLNRPPIASSGSPAPDRPGSMPGDEGGAGAASPSSSPGNGPVSWRSPGPDTVPNRAWSGRRDASLPTGAWWFCLPPMVPSAERPRLGSRLRCSGGCMNLVLGIIGFVVAIVLTTVVALSEYPDR
jgi:hypothetical protein